MNTLFTKSLYALLAIRAACTYVQNIDDDLNHVHQCRQDVLDAWNEVSNECFVEDDAVACFAEHTDDYTRLHEECEQTVEALEAQNKKCQEDVDDMYFEKKLICIQSHLRDP